jgi:hypothetical protein
VYRLIEIVRLLHHYPTYRGQKTETKKAVNLLDAASMNRLSEGSLARLCGYLHELAARKPVNAASRPTPNSCCPKSRTTCRADP